ncbi:hypothetical protein K438DRAFT_2023220 [Mycena galopus ATCC 62051]|nr:hypothetical protein K438DRAFT_2023220 [Mycena galopus ATCC 62051]
MARARRERAMSAGALSRKAVHKLTRDEIDEEAMEALADVEFSRLDDSVTIELFSLMQSLTVPEVASQAAIANTEVQPSHSEWENIFHEQRHVPQPPLWLHRKLQVCRLGVDDTSSGKRFRAVDDTARATRRLAGSGVEGWETAAALHNAALCPSQARTLLASDLDLIAASRECVARASTAAPRNPQTNESRLRNPATLIHSRRPGHPAPAHPPPR